MDNLLEWENKVNFKYSLEEKKCEKVRKGSKKSELSRTLKGGGGMTECRQKEGILGGRKRQELRAENWKKKNMGSEVHI